MNANRPNHTSVDCEEIPDFLVRMTWRYLINKDYSESDSLELTQHPLFSADSTQASRNLTP